MAKITDKEINLALRAQLFSVSERLEIIEEYLIDSGIEYSETIAAKTDRSRSFAQFDEDTWIRVNIKLPKKGFFIEVGVADGISNSNTYWLEKRGWEGICFEPDPRNLAIAELYRKNVISDAVASKNGFMNFGIASLSPDLSGLDNGLAENESIKVKTVTLNSVLKEKKIKTVDFISIDVEGTEVDVLKGFDIKMYKPRVIVLEYLSPTKNIEKDLLEYMERFDYKVAHKTYSNLVFVPKD